MVLDFPFGSLDFLTLRRPPYSTKPCFWAIFLIVGTCAFYISPPNSAAELKFNMQMNYEGWICFLGVLIVQLYNTSAQPKKVVFF